MMLNFKYKPISQKYKLIYNNKLKTTQLDPNAKPNIIKKHMSDQPDSPQVQPG